MAIEFDGKVVIITGAGGGLGRSHALELAKRGALVVVNDLGGALDGTGSGTTAAEHVVKEIEAAGGVAIANFDTVATPEGGEAIVQAALDVFGSVHVVINNAGILRDAAFHKVTPEQIETVLGVHLGGAFNVTRAAWPHLREQGYGRIVNTASGAGLYGNFGQANYGAAKMALVGLTRTLAVEGATKDIKVNAIAPVAKTRMTEEIFEGLGIEHDLGPQFVTPVVVYLASQDCEVTGEVLVCGGGLVAQAFIGETSGYFTDGDMLTPEEVQGHLSEVRDQSGYTVPANLPDELQGILAALGG